jgi:CRISPR-associated endonuclease/helicase Cas3
MYRIRLKAVDSRIATQEELDTAGIEESQIPKDKDGTPWRIAAHQAATVKALRYGNAPFIINHAMTGDGKTMAGSFQLFSEKWRSFAMYPTNELAHDQEQSFNELMREWIPSVWGRIPSKRLINAQEIDDFSFGDDDASRLEKIKGMLRNEYVLSNPDIFHLIMNFAYQQQGVASDILPTYLAERFRLYIFDEFHLFGVEQTASVMIAMLLLKRLAGSVNPPRFLFLSATPQKAITSLAGRVGLAVELIEGSYEHGRIQPSETHRRILQETDLSLYSGRLEDWVKEHYEDVIASFFRKHMPAAKGLLIANSVATAHRIHRFLQTVSGNEIKLGINTGITPKEDRSREFDLLIATSTVDVGVDFKINFLVFESRDAASHLQRLGRLGRHDKDRAGNQFLGFEAHALLPQWTLEGLAKTFPEDEAISREKYKDVLEENFSPLQQFDGYIRHWAGLQAAKVLVELSDKHLRTQYKEITELLKTEYQSLFGPSVKKYFALAKENRGTTISAAASFRGGSIFTALIQDPETNSQKVMSYNLISLLLNADLQAVPIQEMLESARKRGQEVNSLEKTKPLAAYRLLQWLDEPRKIEIELDAELLAEDHETVIEQNRFRIFCPSMPELQTLNRYLYERVLVSFFIPDKDPDLVRRLLRLGYQLELFRFTARGSLTGTVVFGRNALLIDSALIRRKSESAFIW